MILHEVLEAAITWQRQGGRSRWSTKKSLRLYDAIQRYKEWNDAQLRCDFQQLPSQKTLNLVAFLEDALFRMKGARNSLEMEKRRLERERDHLQARLDEISVKWEAINSLMKVDTSTDL